MISKSAFLVRKDGIPYTRTLCRTPELIENYDLAINDTEKTWVCHHRMEQVFSEEELKRAGWYYDRPAQELIFLTASEHNKTFHIEKERAKENKNKNISESLKGHSVSDEIKNKISNTLKGQKLSEETKQKISEAMKDKCHHNKGKHWKLIDGKRVWY